MYDSDILSCLKYAFVLFSFISLQFTKNSLAELEAISERVLAIVCDGFNGHAASLLGLSDEYSQHSCKAYGAVSAIERADQPSVPVPEIRIHNLTFDLNAYTADYAIDPHPQGFHLKLFGSARHRYQALCVPRGDSKLVKTLRTILDRSVSPALLYMLLSMLLFCKS